MGGKLVVSGATLAGTLEPLDEWPILTPSYQAIIPGLAGWGMETTAGSGRHTSPVNTSICIVDRLTTGNTDGSQVSAASGNQPAVYRGSLRYCVERTFPRTIVFETSGVYNMQRTQPVNNPYCTLAFQTAPSPGFFIKNGCLAVQTNDVLAWHMANYNGDETTGQGLDNRRNWTVGDDLAASQRVVAAFCDMFWGSDQNIGIDLGGSNFTVANCLIAEPLANPLNPAYPHNFNAHYDRVENVCMLRCLLAHSKERTPQTRVPHVALANNIMYNARGANWMPVGNQGGYGTMMAGRNNADIHCNYIGNVFIKGPDYNGAYGGVDKTINIQGVGDPNGWGVGPNSQLYMSRNAVLGYLSVDSSQYDIVSLASGSYPANLFQASRIADAWPDGMQAVQPNLAGFINLAARTIGARPGDRSAGHGARVWQEVKNGILGSGSMGSQLESPNVKGGPVTAQVVTRSLSDSAAMSGDPLPLANFNALQPSGYTVGEEWLYRQHLAVMG